MNHLIDNTDLEILQKLYMRYSAKMICYEMKIGHSTYSRRIKKLMNLLNFKSLDELKSWVVDNLSA